MSGTMNSRIFARTWLERNGLFDKDSDYDGYLGECALKAWEYIADQGHSGGSMARMMDILARIYRAYDSPDDPIWVAYWHSDEGRNLLALSLSKETLTDEEVDATIALMARGAKNTEEPRQEDRNA